MGRKKIKLIVTHAKCSKCKMERILYFAHDFTYGERIVSTKSGRQCAYVNLLNENIVQELEKYCTEIFSQNGIGVASSKLARITSCIYGITCDDINGEKIDTISNTKCPYCHEKMVEDNDFGEHLEEIEMFDVKHSSWVKLGDNEKKEKILQELIRQGYLK
mgnify:CR=1 FL=1